MTPPGGSGRRLTADDWIQAGFALLAEGGPDALRIGPLCRRLGVTKGSFYWHFTDMQSYRAAVASAWGALHDERRRRYETMRDVEPRRRLAVMMETLVRPDQWALERAMRVWALTDDTVLDSVQRSDERVLGAVRQAFLDYGFDAEEADYRSALLFSAGIGMLHAAISTGSAPTQVRGRIVDFMLRP